VRALLVLSPAWPELEKMGVPLSKDVYGFSVRNLSSLAGPPGLPPDIRQTLEDALRKAMEDKGVMEQMQRIGELTGFKTGAQVREAIQQVRAEHGAIVEQLGRKKK
jgi:tripartite-type tricarboxylate transporter receptor subunit TctC